LRYFNCQISAARHSVSRVDGTLVIAAAERGVPEFSSELHRFSVVGQSSNANAAKLIGMAK
jgi:hypothetical protein